MCDCGWLTGTPRHEFPRHSPLQALDSANIKNIFVLNLDNKFMCVFFFARVCKVKQLPSGSEHNSFAKDFVYDVRG